MRHTFLVVG